MARCKVFENKDDWRKYRAGYFTSSEAHRLLSEPKLKADKEAGNLSEAAKNYVLERVALLLAPEEPQFFNSKMERGNEEEPQAVIRYAEKIGKSVNDDDFIYTSVGGYLFFANDEYNAGGTPDLIIGDKVGEIKCPDSKTHLKYLIIKNAEQLKKVMPEYYTQLQMNMWLCSKNVTTYNNGVFISYDDRFYKPEQQLHDVEIPYDADFIEVLKAKLLKAKAYKEQILSMLP